MSAVSPTVVESLNEALHRVMQQDDRVHVIGEDILDPYGGAFKVTKGLSSRFPERVWTTPISESAIVGLSVGMAMRGLRPIVEIMFGDFLTLAADQLINHAAKFPWMFNHAVQVPLVVRAPMGGRRGYGATHSQSLEKHFLGVPGLWVVAPSVAGDPGALLAQAALESAHPVLFIESKTCYARPLVSAPSGMAREAWSTAEAPFETVRFRWVDRETNGQVWCYGGMTPVALDAVRLLAQNEGLWFDLAVLSQLSPTPMEHFQWLLETDPELCVLVEEASPTGGWTAECMAAIQECRAQRGRPPVSCLRIGARHEPIGSGKRLEQQTLPQASDLVINIVEQF